MRKNMILCFCRIVLNKKCIHTFKPKLFLIIEQQFQVQALKVNSLESTKPLFLAAYGLFL